jgi:uncharacterized membrane protein
MPYIKHSRRVELQNDPDPFPHNAGELNFLLTDLCLSYLDFMGPGYEHINSVIGALEAAKLEFYRRYAAPYEDEKIKENGDVY